jgi:hypothetical protein
LRKTKSFANFFQIFFLTGAAVSAKSPKWNLNFLILNRRPRSLGGNSEEFFTVSISVRPKNVFERKLFFDGKVFFSKIWF